MKKFSFILVIMICICSLGACGGKPEPKGVKVDSFFDFEDYHRNFQQVRMFEFFGACSQNLDESYVKQGKASAKLQPLGHASGTVKPFIVFPTFANGYDYNFMDFTKFESFIGDFYNAEDKNVEMSIGITPSLPVYVQNLDYVATSAVQTYSLKPGWNDISYIIQHDLLALRHDITKIHGIYLRFDNCGSYNLEDAPVIYADNFRFQEMEGEYVPKNPVTLNKDENAGVWEIASFDKDWQKYCVWVDNYNYLDVVPDLSIANPLMGNKVGNVLKILSRPGNLDGYGWPWIYISEKLFGALDYSNFRDTDEYEFFLRFDLYNNHTERAGLAFEFTSPDGKFTSKNWASIIADPQKWATYSIKLNSINIILERDADGNVTKTQKFVDNPGRMYFVYDGYASQSWDRREFLIDNIRIERVQK